MDDILQKVFEEFEIEFESEECDSFDAVGLDGNKVTFYKKDYYNDKPKED